MKENNGKTHNFTVFLVTSTLEASPKPTAAADPFAAGLGRGLLKPPVVPSTPSTGVLKLLASSRPASTSLLILWLAGKAVLDGAFGLAVVAVDSPVVDDIAVTAVAAVVAVERWTPREDRSMSGVVRRAVAWARAFCSARGNNNVDLLVVWGMHLLRWSVQGGGFLPSISIHEYPQHALPFNPPPPRPPFAAPPFREEGAPAYRKR